MRTALRWANPAVAVAALALVIWRLGTGPFLAGLRAVDGRAVVAATAVVLVTTVCSAWRWTIVARGLGVPLRLSAAFAAYYRAVFLNLTLPSGVAGDVHRGVSHGREAHALGPALRAVVWERVAGQVVQILLAVAVLLVLPSPLRPFMPFVAAVAVALALGAFLVGRARFGADIRNGILRRDALPGVLLASVVVAAGHVATFLIAARAADATAPIPRLLPVVFLAVLATALPNVGGWGPREGLTAWAFSAAGLGAAVGAATAVAFGVLVLAASLPGALVLLAERLPGRRPSFFRPEGAPDA
ncbi:MAG TPA: lysylphosphatidylglycerol synthase domain-containing protein [Gaiellaceae bacterium]|nr:lysylphosphatidylglycerol synthase domain-containing protein [Gaiellaceae bacterium]